jgi:DNA-binding transcriptional LysR family regulator
MRAATLRQLRAFSLVARQRSFAQAAVELNLTPSAISLQIKDLEHVVGLPLFGRTGRSVTLTKAGELLLLDVMQALTALQHADDVLARLQDQPARSVVVGMVSNAKYFLPRLLARFHETDSQVELQLSMGNREQLLERLRAGQVDLAIMGMPPRDLVARSEAFAIQPLGIVASPRHCLAGVSAIPVAALSGDDFIVREPGSGTRAAMEGYFAEAGVHPRRLMVMCSNEAIKQAVIGGMGVAFLSLHTVGLELQAGLLVALDVAGLPLRRNWCVVQQDTVPACGAAQDLRRFVLTHGAEAISQQFDESRQSQVARLGHL